MEQENYYPKSNELLYSMALRSDHGFGMYEKEQQDQMIENMSKVYDLYVSGKTDQQISEEIKYYHFYIRNKGTKEYIALIPKEHIESLTLEL